MNQKTTMIFATLNTQYHLDADEVCIEVRDLRTNTIVPSHKALGAKLANPFNDTPKIGESLFFPDGNGRMVVTSRIVRIDVPSQALAQSAA